MRFEKRDSKNYDGTVFIITLSDADFASYVPDNFSALLQAECEDSGKISDKLLFLEHMARLIERS